MMTKLFAATFASLFAVGAAQADSILAQSDDGKIFQLTISGSSVTETEVTPGGSSYPNVGADVGNSPNGLALVNGTVYRAQYGDRTTTQNVYQGTSASVFATPTTSGSAIAAAAGLGNLYVFADSAGNIRSFDTISTTTQNNYGSVGSSAYYGDLVVKDATTLILSYSGLQNANPQFGTFDLTLGNFTSYTFATNSPVTKWAGLAFGQSGQLYGVRAAGETNAKVYAINLSGTEVSYSAIGNFASNQAYTDAAPVPIPAAAWLFGSALIGAIGLGRRKRNNALKA
jgi:hypothetical protein